ncbi:Dabb family protein [Evtepia gabavorous]|uniref:Dabb family protein n=1 Tax=Evtepia gabavorous TaxID=2211183 RepID=UPI00399A1F49
MVKHIVIYQLREDCDKQAAVQEISQALEPLVGVIPGLQWLEVCPTYQGDADYVLYSEFDSAEALAGYQVHPDHVAAKEVVHKYVATRMAADYEYCFYQLGGLGLLSHKL